MPQLKGLIFDLDGTLLDSAPDLRQALNATLKEYERPALDLEKVKSLTGDGMMPLVNRAFEATGGLPPNFNSYNCVQTFISHYRNLKADESQIYPKVRETLEIYQKAGIPLGICTNKQEAASLRLLDELDLGRHFTFVAGGDTFQMHKPHPDHVRGVMGKLHAAPGNCVMIGDGPNDVIAAHSAGIPCIVVTHGYSPDYGKLGADKLIGNFSELGPALESLGFKLG